VTSPNPFVMLTTSIFAPEISDLIIDQLSDDPEALQTCARLSRMWTARSRYYLFKHVEISTQSRKRTKAFFKLLRSPHQTIKHFIRSLTITHSPSNSRTILDSRLDEWTMDAVPDLILLTSVRALTLNIVQLEESLPSLFIPCFQEVLTDLTIQGHFTCVQSDFESFVCSFTRLRHLTLNHLGDLHTYINVLSHLPSTLHTLHLFCDIQSPSLQWFSWMVPMPPLRTIHVTGLSSWMFRPAGEVMRGVGSHLEHLELDLSYSSFRGN
jgi:hypothetical protein